MLDSFKIIGNRQINGQITVQGAKNSVLPILAATLLIHGVSIIHNCPKLSDVDVAVEILKSLGCIVERQGNTITVDASDVHSYEVPDDLMAKMRSSVMFLGPILARCKSAKLSLPGGCELGPRPIDLHLSAIEMLGAKVLQSCGNISCVSDKLIGTDIHLSFPSVGATENIMLAATSASGKTRIINAACEPEIIDIANYLCEAGFKIKGIGTSVVEIENSNNIKNFVEYKVMPDRIVAQTYLNAAAITRGKITLCDVSPNDVSTGISVLEKMGISLEYSKNKIILDATNADLISVEPIKTMPYPGFPTDAQAIFMSLLAVADGTTIFCENIFDNRYRHVEGLVKMGADIKTIGKVCVVNGVNILNGAKVCATDLRGGAALVLAALYANGVSEISNIHHIDRGYENFEINLRSLGAEVYRI